MVQARNRWLTGKKGVLQLKYHKAKLAALTYQSPVCEGRTVMSDICWVGMPVKGKIVLERIVSYYTR